MIEGERLQSSSRQISAAGVHFFCESIEKCIKHTESGGVFLSKGESLLFIRSRLVGERWRD